MAGKPDDIVAHVDVEAVTARARAALVYFLRARPGKRSSALSALWLGLTGIERDGRAWQYLDNHVNYVIRTYEALPSGFRGMARAALTAALAIEIDPIARAGMAALLRRCDELEHLAYHSRQRQRRSDQANHRRTRRVRTSK